MLELGAPARWRGGPIRPRQLVLAPWTDWPRRFWMHFKRVESPYFPSLDELPGLRRIGRVRVARAAMLVQVRALANGADYSTGVALFKVERSGKTIYFRGPLVVTNRSLGGVGCRCTRLQPALIGFLVKVESRDHHDERHLKENFEEPPSSAFWRGPTRARPGPGGAVPQPTQPPCRLLLVGHSLCAGGNATPEFLTGWPCSPFSPYGACG